MADKEMYMIKVEGKLIEVTSDVYYAYFRMERQERWQEEKQQGHAVVSYDALDDGETVGVEVVPDLTTPSMEEAVMTREIHEKLHRAVEALPKTERELIAQATGCAIVLIGHLNKAAGTQSTYRGLGSIDITAAVRSLLFIGKLKDSPTTRVLIHEKSSLAPPGQSLAFSLGDEKGFEWIGAYDITADELLAGTDTAKTESKTAQAQMLILELLADGKRMPSAELEKAVNERGISSRTMRTAKSRIGDRLVTEKDGTAWVCYLRD